MGAASARAGSIRRAHGTPCGWSAQPTRRPDGSPSRLPRVRAANRGRLLDGARSGNRGADLGDPLAGLPKGPGRSHAYPMSSVAGGRRSVSRVVLRKTLWRNALKSTYEIAGGRL